MPEEPPGTWAEHCKHKCRCAGGGAAHPSSPHLPEKAPESHDRQLGNLRSSDVISEVMANYAASAAAGNAAADGNGNDSGGEEKEGGGNEARGGGDEICIKCLLWPRAGLAVYTDALISTS